ncbi:MAG: hypothetical protein WC043_04310 [Pseudobdellovibrionaceae bacterium]
MSLFIEYNCVAWLRGQAARAFDWDRKTVAHFVKRRADTPEFPVHKNFARAYEGLMDIRDYFPKLHHNRMADMFEGEGADMIEKVGDILEKEGYADFSFLDHGGRALAFRARHKESGKTHVIRAEAPHAARQARPQHATVLPSYFTHEGADIMHIKLEALDEVVPLSKLPDRPQESEKGSPFYDIFHRAVYHLGWGTNLTYPKDMFDRDAEPQNVGITPEGRIVTFDPEIIQGPRALHMQRQYETPMMLRDASPQQLRLVYGR